MGRLEPRPDRGPKGRYPVPDYTVCPDSDCAMIAEITDTWDAETTNGPLRMQKTVCVQKHWFTVPVY